MGHGPRTLTHRQVRAVFTEREREGGPTGRVIIASLLRGKTREKRAEKENEKSTKEENEGREKEERTREREKERREERRERETPPVCRFKTSPCVGSKGLRGVRAKTRACVQHARFAGTQEGVLNLHTETF